VSGSATYDDLSDAPAGNVHPHQKNAYATKAVLESKGWILRFWRASYQSGDIRWRPRCGAEGGGSDQRDRDNSGNDAWTHRSNEKEISDARVS
jgi:hypothetical protein